MFIVSESFCGKYLQGNPPSEVILFIYLIDISGSNVAKEVIANDLRPTIPDKVPKNL